MTVPLNFLCALLWDLVATLLLMFFFASVYIALTFPF